MNQLTAAEQQFARLCRRGVLAHVQIRAGHPLTVSGHVLDPRLGDLVLRIRLGPEDEDLPEASHPTDGEPDMRKWVSVNGIQAPLLPNDGSIVPVISPFPELATEMSRDLVNEAVQALSSIWDAAAARVESDRSRHIQPARSLKRLNRIAQEEDLVRAWAKLIKGLLIRGVDLNGKVSSLRFEPASGLVLPNHFHKVNVFLRFIPAGGREVVAIGAVWRDAGGVAAALDVEPCDEPVTGRDLGHGDTDSVLTSPARSGAIQDAREWLAAVEHGAHEFVYGVTLPVVQRISEAPYAGHLPDGPEMMWRRAAGARSCALAHLNRWAREVFS
jgi:hypothetical protein